MDRYDDEKIIEMLEKYFPNTYEDKNGWINSRKAIQLISYTEDCDSHLVEIKG